MDREKDRDVKYRHEQKYLCTGQELVDIENRIKGMMSRDSHGDEDGKYNIRSVYFDDFWDSCYWDNEDGVNPREKFRIRVYNCSPEYIKLELKRKERGKTLKKSCRIDYSVCMQILTTGQVPLTGSRDPVYRKLYYLNQTKGLKPKVIVEYNRTVYTYRQGNVRVTFDEDICSSGQVTELFSQTLRRRPIMESGMHILEVKYDEFLPDFIYAGLQKGYLRETTFSKYYNCRKITVR